MPSSFHELMVGLFRKGCEMPRELLGDLAPAPTLVAESASIDFTQIVPTEYRADHVITYRDPARGLAARLALIIEVQLRIDRHKQRTWPVYVATAAATFDCDARLMVITPYDKVAEWARGPFGPEDFRLAPTVFSFRDLARLIDREKVDKQPALAVLRAIAEPSLANVLDAHEIMETVLPSHVEAYWDMLLSRLSNVDRQLMEVMKMESYYKFQSHWGRRQMGLAKREGYHEGKAEGRQEGVVEGQRVGEARGLLKGVAAAALELARVKLGATSPAEEHVIRTLQDPAQLTALVVALGQAADAAQARAALAAARGAAQT